MDESDLIRKALQGDQVAFAEAFEPHRGKLRGVAFGILKEEDAAADAVSDAYEKAWNSFERDKTFSPGRKLYPWLYKIVKNLCLTAAKRNSIWVSPDDQGEEGREEGDEAPRYRKKEGGPSIGEHDLHLQILVAEEEREEATETTRKARATFLEEARKKAEKWSWPNEKQREHAFRIVQDTRAVELLDMLTNAGAHVSRDMFFLTVRTCAEFSEPIRMEITKAEAKAAIKVIETLGWRVSDSEPGDHRIDANLEKLLSMLRPIASRKGTKTTLHKYYCRATLDQLFRKLCGGKPVDKAIVLALEMTYGKPVSLKGLPQEKSRARRAVKGY